MNKLFWLVKWKILRDLIIKIIIAFVFTRHSYPVMCLAFSMLHRCTMHSANEAEATGCRQNAKKATSYLDFNMFYCSLTSLFLSDLCLGVLTFAVPFYYYPVFLC